MKNTHLSHHWKDLAVGKQTHPINVIIPNEITALFDYPPHNLSSLSYLEHSVFESQLVTFCGHM